MKAIKQKSTQNKKKVYISSFLSKEDYALGKAILEAEKSSEVSQESVMKLLRG